MIERTEGDPTGRIPVVSHPVTSLANRPEGPEEDLTGRDVYPPRDPSTRARVRPPSRFSAWRQLRPLERPGECSFRSAFERRGRGHERYFSNVRAIKVHLAPALR